MSNSDTLTRPRNASAAGIADALHASQAAPADLAATLFEHDDGRYAVAPGTGSPEFTQDDPAWHRVGPVDVSAVAPSASTPAPAATKPRAKAAPVAPAYTRPVQTFFPEVGKTAEERLAALRATLQAADEKLEAAYDAAERGSAVDTLLDLIAHDLMCSVMSPLMRDADEADIPVTKGSIEVAHQTLFPVLAALEGAMALSVGTVLSTTLAEAFNLLNWAQDECDSAALGALMPAAVEPDSTPTTPEAGLDWLEVDRANGIVGNARVLLELLVQEAAFSYSDPIAAEAAQSRIIVLGDAADDLLTTAENLFGQMVVKLQGAAS